MARIEDYALLGDLQTGALVTTTGSIDWLCLPRFDSPACFAALLDTPDAGHWQIAPESGGTCTSRRYVGDTLVLETEWVTPEGTIRVIDFMLPRGHAPDGSRRPVFRWRSLRTRAASCTTRRPPFGRVASRSGEARGFQSSRKRCQASSVQPSKRTSVVSKGLGVYTPRAA